MSALAPAGFSHARAHHPRHTSSLSVTYIVGPEDQRIETSNIYSSPRATVCRSPGRGPNKYGSSPFTSNENAPAANPTRRSRG
eukprot:1502427-Pyramimonas_sp.AAC.1